MSCQLKTGFACDRGRSHVQCLCRSLPKGEVLSVLVGSKVILREIRSEDIGQLMEWDHDRELAAFMGEIWSRPKGGESWIDFNKGKKNKKIMIIESFDRNMIGHIELTHIIWRSGDAELIIRIGDRRYWNKGYGTDSILLFLDYAFNILNLSRIYLRVYSFNRRAVYCYKKCGFKPEGAMLKRSDDGKTEKVILMRILREEYLEERKNLPSEERAGAGIGRLRQIQGA